MSDTGRSLLDQLLPITKDLPQQSDYDMLAGVTLPQQAGPVAQAAAAQIPASWQEAISKQSGGTTDPAPAPDVTPIDAKAVADSYISQVAQDATGPRATPQSVYGQQAAAQLTPLLQPDGTYAVQPMLQKGEYEQGIASLKQALPDYTRAQRASFDALAIAAQKDNAVNQGLLSTLSDTAATQQDAADKIAYLDRNKLLGESTGIFDIIGMFDPDYNREYQANRIATAEQTADIVARKAAAEHAVNDYAPRVAQISEQAKAAQIAGIQNALGFDDKLMEFGSRRISEYASLTQAAQQTLNAQITQANDRLVAKNAAAAGPTQGAWQEENYRRQMVKLQMSNASMAHDVAVQQRALMYVRPDDLKIGLDNAVANKSSTVSMTSPWGHGTIQIPYNMARNAYIDGIGAEDAFAQKSAADRIAQLSLPQRLASMRNKIATFSVYAPELKDAFKGLDAITGPGNTAALTTAQANAVSSYLDRVDGMVGNVAKAVAKTYNTPSAQAAIMDLYRTGQMTPQAQTAFLDATAQDPGSPNRVAFRGVMGQIQAAAQKLLDNPSKMGVQGMPTKDLAALAIKDPAKARMLATHAVLSDPNFIRSLQGGVQNATAGMSVEAALRMLATQPNANPIWQHIYSNPTQWKDNDGANTSMLAQALTKAELQSTLANGKGGRSMRGVYTNTFTQAMQKVANDPGTLMGDPRITLEDQAIAGHAYGGRTQQGFAAGANLALGSWRKNAASAAQQINQRIQDDISGKTMRQANTNVATQAFYGTPVAVIGGATAGGLSSMLVKHKAQLTDTGEVQSSTGVRASVQDLINYYGGQ